MTNIDRKKALESALSQIDKQFGKGSAMKYGDRPQLDIEVIPSGSLALDVALGVGGYPRGRIIEIYGPESSGKTTLIDLITGLIKPTKGSLLIDNVNITDKNTKICNKDIS